MTKAQLAADLCDEFPESSTKQLARMLVKRYPIAFKDAEAARGILRYVRGQSGEENRKSRKGKVREKKPRLECPESSEALWIPHEIDKKDLLVISDLHFPYHSKGAIEAMVDHSMRLGPRAVLINGDGIDFHSISRFQRHPSQRDTAYEVESLKGFLEWFRSKHPRVEIIYKKGNHENWWDKLIWDKAPEIWGLRNVQLENVLGLDKFRIKILGDVPVMAGKLAILHGHELGKGSSGPVNPARSAFTKTLSSVMIGHFHRSSSHPEGNMFHDEIACWSTGCLCGLYPEYARVNKWNWGFAYIEIAKDGQFGVHNFRIGKGYAIRPS